MWHSQIDKITQKIASGIGAIERIGPLFFFHQLLKVPSAMPWYNAIRWAIKRFDLRAVWRLFQRPVFHPKKPGKVARVHETSLNDQLSHGPDLTTDLVFIYWFIISKLLLQQKKTITQVWL